MPPKAKNIATPQAGPVAKKQKIEDCVPVVVDDHPFHAFAKKQILAPLADVLEEVRKQGALPSAGMQP